MIDESVSRPDITLTLDSRGVILEAVGSKGLADEDLRPWQGLNLKETVESVAGSRVANAIEQSRQQGESALIQLVQKLPSGREAPIEYTMISLGKKAGFVAIGRNLQVVADLHSRLAEAHQARERDYWKLREIETCYRALLDASQEAVALVRAETLRVVEANVVATKALKLVPGAQFLPDLPQQDKKALSALLDVVRGQGRAPGIALHLANGAQWRLRASWIASDAGAFFFFQMTELAGAQAPSAKAGAFPLEEIVERFPDAFALVDREGVIKRANFAFLDLAQVGVEMAALGQPLKRWLSHPGADASVVLGIVARHGSVRRMPSRFEGDFGVGVDVEISAVGERREQAEYVGLLFHEVSALDAAASAPEASIAAPALALPDASLEQILKTSVAAIERKSIAQAMEQSRGNRTLAAKYLGLSRQSLHAKLRKYSLVFKG